MSEQSIDQELVNEVIKGNKHAFDALTLKYQNRILKVVSRYIQDPTEALDVVQDSFIKAYQALPKFRGESSFYTWLFRIAVNTAKNHLLLLSRRPKSIGIDVENAAETHGIPKLKEQDTPEGCLERDEVEKAVFAAMNDLPEELKNAIVLRELVGLSYADIAKVMNCPLGTVRSRIFRAREMIDSIIQSGDKEKGHPNE